jgi:hypothetical protein
MVFRISSANSSYHPLPYRYHTHFYGYTKPRAWTIPSTRNFSSWHVILQHCFNACRASDIHHNLPVITPFPIISLSKMHDLITTPDRSITTPYKLSSFNAIKSLRAILTPTERRKPWTLYLTPGLLASETLHIVIVVLGLGPIRRLLIPASFFTLKGFSFLSLGIWVLVVLATTVILSPLEVMSIRLAIQRNHASSDYNSVSQEIEGDAEEIEFAGNEEDVIGCVRSFEQLNFNVYVN